MQQLDRASLNELIKAISKIKEYIYKYGDYSIEKYSDCIYCLDWLIHNAKISQGYLPKKPTKKQRKNAIDVVTEVAEADNLEETKLQEIKAYAEIAKRGIDEQLPY